jgi:hypothetical protein
MIRQQSAAIASYAGVYVRVKSYFYAHTSLYMCEHLRMCTYSYECMCLYGYACSLDCISVYVSVCYLSHHAGALTFLSGLVS